VPERRITCPSCKKTLLVEQGVNDPWLTCPHCLTRVPNPSQAVQTAAPSGPPAREDAPTCPVCAEVVDPRWVYCPYCNERLRPGRRRGPGEKRFAMADVDVRRDAVGSASGLGFLALIVLFGFFILVCGGGLRSGGAGSEVTVILPVLICVIAAGTLGIIRRWPRSVLSLGIKASALLLCGTIAVILFLAFLCAQVARH
jgi:hypothetical protein